MVRETDNHGLNKFDQGESDWTHSPDMQTAEERLPVRDVEANLDQYTPHAGATFIATDTGAEFDGDGDAWSRATRSPEHLRSRTEPVVNVRAYGAVGDGTTDNADAIEAAKAAAEAVDGALYFPPGTFETSAYHDVVNGSVRIFGDGPDSTTIRSTGANDAGSYVFRLRGGAHVIENLHIDCNGSTLTGLRCRNTADQTVRNVHVTNIAGNGDAVVGIWVRESPGTIVRGCRVEDVDSGAGGQARGVQLDDSPDSKAVQCHVENITPDDDADGYRIGGTSEHNVLRDCVAVDCAKRAVKAQASDTLVTGCTLRWTTGGPSSAAISFQLTDSGRAIDNRIEAETFPNIGIGVNAECAAHRNTIVLSAPGTGDDAIQLSGTNPSANDNTIDMGGGGRSGIRVRDDADGATVNGNTVYGGTDYCIFLQDEGAGGPDDVSICGGSLTGDRGILCEDATNVAVTGLSVDSVTEDYADANAAMTLGTNV